MRSRVARQPRAHPGPAHAARPFGRHAQSKSATHSNAANAVAADEPRVAAIRIARARPRSDWRRRPRPGPRGSCSRCPLRTHPSRRPADRPDPHRRSPNCARTRARRRRASLPHRRGTVPASGDGPCSTGESTQTCAMHEPARAPRAAGSRCRRCTASSQAPCTQMSPASPQSELRKQDTPGPAPPLPVTRPHRSSPAVAFPHRCSSLGSAHTPPETQS